MTSLKQRFKSFLAFCLLISTAPGLALAQDQVIENVCDRLDPIGRAFGQNNLCLNDNARQIFIERVVAVVNVFLSLFVLVMVILIMYAGYLWMTARGNESQVDDAKHTLRSAIIGAIVLLSAGIITNFVAINIYNATIGS